MEFENVVHGTVIMNYLLPDWILILFLIFGIYPDVLTKANSLLLNKASSRKGVASLTNPNKIISNKFSSWLCRSFASLKYLKNL